MGANVAIEMAASGVYSGRLVLLSPAFSRADEASFLWVLDRIGRIPALGGLAWKAMTAMIPSGMKGSLPSEHRQAWMAQLKKNDWRHFRSAVRSYSEYLSGQPALVGRLCDSGVKAWVAFDGPKDTRLTDGERRVLDACTTVHLVDWPEAGHYTLGETASVADLISEAASVA